MQRLQGGGVPAAAMLRLPELLTDPHLCARDTFQPLSHPLLSAALPSATRVARFSAIAEAPLRPARLPGQDTEAICRELLHLSENRIAELIADGVIEIAPAAAPLLP
jgi:crotonobetainyl-CoA:carnitine CoA-transferase CaiB-like acyl-CoA transferase